MVARSSQFWRLISIGSVMQSLEIADTQASAIGSSCISFCRVQRYPRWPFPAQRHQLPLQRGMPGRGWITLFADSALEGSGFELPVPLCALIAKSGPGRAAPLTQSFVDLPFDRAALDSVPTLLNPLRRAEVRVTGANR
jgi:hypothetical protein